MPCTPVALDEAPRPRHIDGVPRITEAIVFEFDAGLVTGRLAVALNDDAVQPCVAIKTERSFPMILRKLEKSNYLPPYSL